MKKYSKNIFTVSVIWTLALTQILTQTAYADIKYSYKDSTLAPSPASAVSSVNPEVESFKRSIISDIKLMSVVTSIGRHYLAYNKRTPTVARTIRDRYRENPEFLRGIILEEVRRQNNIVYIPYEENGRKYQIIVSSKDKIKKKAANSYQWAELDNYIVDVIFDEIGQSKRNSLTGSDITAADWPVWSQLPKEKRGLVLVSGGDCAGLNPFIGYLAAELARHGIAIAGVKDGLDGLVRGDIEGNIIPVGYTEASNMPYWSSIEFGSTRKSLKEGSAETDQALTNIINNVSFVVVIGGNDHIYEAVKLASMLERNGITVIGAPKTIDNDTLNTVALGVATSAQISMEETYRAAAMPGSGRCVIVEPMGRNMGSLAVSAGNRYPENFDTLPQPLRDKVEAARPTMMTLVPEYAITIDGIIAQARARMNRYGGVTVVAAEGFKISKYDPRFSGLKKSNPTLAAILKGLKEDEHHNIIIPQGIAAEFLAEILKELNPKIEVLGFTPRGPMPTDDERILAEGFAKLAAKAILEKMTGYGVACSDIAGDPEKGVIKLVPLEKIAAKTADGKSRAKTLDQIYSAEELKRAGVIVEESQPIDDFNIVRLSQSSEVKHIPSLARAILATSKSAWAHKRPSILFIGGHDAEGYIKYAIEYIEQSQDGAVAHDYGLVRDSLIVLGGEHVSLQSLLEKVYAVNSERRFVNIIVAGNFKISKKDPLIKILAAKSEEFAERIKLAESRRGDSEYYVFDGDLKDLAQVLKLALLNAEPVSRDLKQLSDVRLTSLDLSLNELPNESRSSLTGSLFSNNKNAIITAMQEDDWKYLLAILRKGLQSADKNYSELMDILSICEEAIIDRWWYPVEARYPILRAVSLLSEEEQGKLIYILGLPVNKNIRNLPLVDSIMLMFGVISSDWVEAQAPDLKGRNVWQVSSEIWYAAGGLGRVMQYHGKAMYDLLKGSGATLKHIEPKYLEMPDPDNRGSWIPLDYTSKKVMANPIVGELVEVARFPVTYGGGSLQRNTEAVCYRGYNDLGVEVYLIEDRDGFVTKGLYRYGDGYSLPSWAQFTDFMSQASLELVRRIETQEKGEKGDAWKAPILHGNDGQLSLIGLNMIREDRYFIDDRGESVRYLDDSVTQSIIYTFTTHTYRNRGGDTGQNGKRLLEVANIPYQHWHLFEHDAGQVWDFTSCGLRTSVWSGAVSYKHLYDVAKFDLWRGVHTIAVTNGDDRAKTAVFFRHILRELYPGIDVEHPEPEQVLAAKKEAKKRFTLKPTRFYSTKPDEDKDGLRIDPNKKVIVYTGRLVPEKAGLSRAFDKDNIEAYLADDAQIIIAGNVQNYSDSEYLAEELKKLIKTLTGKNYSGKLVFIPQFTLSEQRAILSGADFVVLDSDPDTEAAGFSETDGAATGCIVVAPPWPRGEGIIVAQGIKLNPDIIDEDNTIIPDIQLSEEQTVRVLYDEDIRAKVELAYREAMLKWLKVPEDKLAHYQATSVKLSRVLEHWITGGEYLRQFGKAVKTKEALSEDASGSRQSMTGSQNNISLVGLDISESQRAQFKKFLSSLIHSGKVTSLFADRPALFPHDKDIEQDDTQGEFFDELRRLKDRLPHEGLPHDFEILIVDDRENRLPPYMVMSAGYKRGQAYIQKGYLKVLSDLYATLDSDDRTEMINLILEAFRHEHEHLVQYQAMVGRPNAPPVSEKNIDRTAPSFRARALFRIAYAVHKTGRIPNMKQFFSVLRSNGRSKISYLNAYLALDSKGMLINPDTHLEMARLFLEGRPSIADIVLARHHLAAIFGNFPKDSAEFKEAVTLLKRPGVIAIGPESGRPFPMWKYITQLIVHYSVIDNKKPIADINVKVRDFAQVSEWERGDERHSGDSLYYPMPGETTAIPESIDTVIGRIMSLEGGEESDKEAIVKSLEKGDGGSTIISADALDIIGSILAPKCNAAVSVAGKGTRFAEVIFDEEGRIIRSDMAKAVYPYYESDDRTILEVAIAQIRGINRSRSADVELDLYTSHLTDSDIRDALKSLGFREGRWPWGFHPDRYTHHAEDVPVIHLTRLRKTSLFNVRTGDFLSDIDASLTGTDPYWPDAHDTVFLDFIVSGRAWECVSKGKRYNSCSTIDNRGGIPDGKVLAMLYLTGRVLANEGVLNKGQPGGAIIKIKDGMMPEEWAFFSSRKGVVEKDEFSGDIMEHLKSHPEDVRQYAPLFNSANFTYDIIGLAKTVFGDLIDRGNPDISDQAVLEWLKKFYDYRKDDERIAELRYALEEHYRRTTQRLEADKTHDNTVQPSYLSGLWTWLVPDDKKIILESPAGEGAGGSTRFEDIKVSIINLRNELSFMEFLIDPERNGEANNGDTLINNAVLSAENSQKRQVAQLRYYQGEQIKKPVTIGGRIEAIRKEIAHERGKLKRIKEKGGQAFFRPEDIARERKRPADNNGGQHRNSMTGAIGHQTFTDSKIVSAMADASNIHRLNVESMTPVENGIMYHVIPLSLIPQHPEYNQRARFRNFVRQMEREYPDSKERIIIVEDDKDIESTVRRLADGNIVDVALPGTVSLEKYNLPSNVKMLIFEDARDEAGNIIPSDFVQVEGIIASLRALHIKDTSVRNERLSRLYEILTGQKPPVIGDIDDPVRLARKIIFVLQPVTVKDIREFKQLNDNMQELLMSA